MITGRDLSQARWRKAQKSISQGGCVEVADLGAEVAMRDSKDPDGPALLFTTHEWDCFLDGVQKGEFNRTTNLT